MIEPTVDREAARGGAANLLGALVSAAVNLVIVAVIARGLPKVDAGAFFGATSLFVIVATAARIGTDVSVVHFLARARALSEPQALGGFVRAAVIPVLAAGGVAALCLAVATPALLDLIADDEVAQGDLLVATVALVVPIAAAYDALIAATRGLGATRPTVVVERLLRPSLQALLIALAVLGGGGAYAAVLAWLVPYVLAAAIAAWWLSRLLRRAGGDVGVRLDRRTRSRFWRFTWPPAVTGVLQITLQRLDILLVGGLLGPAEAAVYAAATRIVVVGQLVNQAIAHSVQAQLAMALAVGDVPAARRLYQVSTAWIVAITWPVYLTVALGAPLILALIGPGYESGISTMVVLAVAGLISAAAGLVDFVLITFGKTTWSLSNTAFALLVNVVADLLLIPEIGIVGAAIGWALAIAAAKFLPLIQVGRQFGFQPASRAGLIVASLALTCFGAVPGAVLLLFGPTSWAVPAAILAGGAIYVRQLAARRGDLALDSLRPERSNAAVV
ncbi:MAG: oligosaccharide flippase family protein [Solirubrobacteraceae bacterium]|nr:oligosaccharide flippase family protein [Solirubrobacteraceae bacterium]